MYITGKKTPMYLVAKFENGWEYGPADKLTIFLDRKEAMKAFKEMVKESKDEEYGSQHKICVAQIESGSLVYFSGYGGAFEGGKLIKEYDYEG